jgi:DNA-binding response OmpR family regulator
VPRILIVDDEPNIVKAIETELTSDGYLVDVAADGEAAVVRGRSGGYDLIVLDLNLPLKDGATVCRELRTHGCDTPILMLTCRSTEADRVLGLDLGADDYVIKPFSNPELRARVRALLRRSKSRRADMIVFGSVEVDCSRAEARVDEVPVLLTATEYKLLCCFIRSQGKILPRESIIADVWEGRSINDRVVDNCVLHLRTKLEPDPQNPIYFIGVRGLGYRFEGDRVHDVSEGLQKPRH